MKKIFALLLIIFSATLHAQNFSAYSKELFIQNNDTLPYRLLLPENYDASKKYPLIIFLHGSGERGNDNESQLSHGADLFLKDDIRKNYPAIIVFPQCPENSSWSNVSIKTDSSGKELFDFSPAGKPTTAMVLTEGMIKGLTQKYAVNKKQVYVGGLSMGGMGTFEIVRRNPKLFAAAFPMCGGANPSSAKKLKHTAWWIFHGAKDDVVNPAFSQQMADALTNIKADVKFTLYPNANHNCWDSAFAEPELLSWLFSHYK